MPFEDVYRVSDRLRLVPVAEIDALESRLGFPLPFGYRDYLTTLGIGHFCEKLEVWTPERVEEQREYWHKEFVPLAVEEGFWDAEPVLLTAAEMAETVVFASTDEGDHFVCCPSKGREVYELPRHEQRMRRLPEGFLQPFDCAYGARERFRFPFFAPESDTRMLSQIFLGREADAARVWALVRAAWGDGLRLVEGDADSEGRAKVFIKAIEGEFGRDDVFYLKYDVTHEEEAFAVLRQVRPLVAKRGGSWPDE